MKKSIHISTYIFILCVMLFASGCMAGKQWHHNTANQNQFNRDVAVCQSYAIRTTPQPQPRQPQNQTNITQKVIIGDSRYFSSPYEGATQAQLESWNSGNTVADQMVAGWNYQQQKQQVFNGCMYEKGYYLMQP